MNVDYNLYNVMLDYIDCNILAHILYLINANNTIINKLKLIQLLKIILNF